MAKSKLTEFKKYITSLQEEELRAELHKLYQKLPQVQEFYAQELLSDTERKAMLNEYKKKIDNQYWTRGGNPKIASNPVLKQIITDFEKVTVSMMDLVDLILHRVEATTNSASQFGGAPDSDYKTAHTAFQKAVKLMAQHKLQPYFKERCQELLATGNLDFWYIEWLEGTYEEYFGFD